MRNTPTLQPDRRGYDPSTHTYHAHVDRTERDTLPVSVCRAIASFTGDAPEDMSPVSDVIDLDALNDIFRNRRGSGRPSDHVLITHEECEVAIFRNGHIVIQPPAHDT